MLLEEKRKRELTSPTTEQPERETPPRPDTELLEQPKASSPPPNSPEVCMNCHKEVLKALKMVFAGNCHVYAQQTHFINNVQCMESVE